MSVGGVGGTGGVDPYDNVSGGMDETTLKDAGSLDQALIKWQSDAEKYPGICTQDTLNQDVKAVCKAWNKLITDTGYTGDDHLYPDKGKDYKTMMLHFHQALQCMKSQDSGTGIITIGFDSGSQTQNYIAYFNPDYWDATDKVNDIKTMADDAYYNDYGRIPQNIRDEFIRPT